MKGFLLFIGLGLFPFFYFGQSSHERLLRDHETYASERNWKVKAQILEEILNIGLDVNELDLFESEARKLILFSKKRNDDYYLNIGRFLLTDVLLARNEVEEVGTTIKSALAFFQKEKDFKYLGYLYRNLGILYNTEGKNESALSAFQSSIDYFKEINLPIEYCHSEVLKSSILIEFREFGEAKKVLFKAIHKMKEHKKYITLFRYFHLLANIYSETKETNKEIWANSRSYDFALKSKNPTTIALAQNNIAIVKYYQGDKEAALHFFGKALEMRLKSGKLKLVCEAYYNIASVWQEIDKEKASFYFNKSIDFASEHGFLVDESDARLALVEMYKETKEYEKVIENYEIYISNSEKLQELDFKEADLTTFKTSGFKIESAKLDFKKRIENLQEKVDNEKRKVVYLLLGYVLFSLTILFLYTKWKKINFVSQDK